MTTTYTDAESSPGTVHTNAESSPSTPIKKVEPIGFGISQFGNPNNKEEKEYGRGFGDPKTKHTVITD